MSKLLCRFLGHAASDFTDSGYLLCRRCGSHAYYDSHEWLTVWLWPPLYWWHQAHMRWEDYRREQRLKNFNPDKDCPF